MKKSIMIILAMLVISGAFTQGDTTITVPVISPAPSGEGLFGTIAWFIASLQDFAGNLLAVLLVLDLIARRIPTWEDGSPLTGIIEWLDKTFIGKNRAVSGGKFITKIEQVSDQS